MQRGHVFPDNKTFVGAAPRQRPATILATWQREKAQPGFQLKAFVTARFDLPTDGAVPFQSNVAAGLRHHLDTLWTVLARPAAPAPTDSLAAFRSLLPLPKPYLVPVGLNCLLYTLEMTLADAARVAGQPAQARAYNARARQRQAALLALCWDAQAGWFQDYNWRLRQRSAVRTLAGVLPLAFGLATPAQASRVGAGLKANFLKAGGLVTTLSATGQQWDAPNGWAPLRYLAIEGLTRYQQRPLADTVARRWPRLNRRVFAQTGKLLEKYDVRNPNRPAGGGEYPLQDGFGWTNATPAEPLRAEIGARRVSATGTSSLARF